MERSCSSKVARTIGFIKYNGISTERYYENAISMAC